MSHAGVTAAHAHRPTTGPAKPSASGANPGPAGPAGLFAMLLRGQQDEADTAAPSTPEPDASSEDASAEQRPEAAPAAPADAPPAPPEAPTPPPTWTPTVRSAAGAEPTTQEAGATEPMQRLGGVGRGRAAHGPDTLERSQREADDAPVGEAGDRPAAARDAAAPAADATTDAPLLRPADDPAPDTAPAPAAAPGTLPSLGHAADTTATAPTPAPADAAPTARAHLPQPPTSPAFAPALGLQLSTWLREGVQHAALELNPAELGPIDVRIALRDGQAQVALAADVPFTRQALADALPQLAEALGEVGVQLAGGDVSDQAGRRARDEALAGPRGSGSARPGAAEPGVSAAPAAARRRGLLDLYA